MHYQVDAPKLCPPLVMTPKGGLLERETPSESRSPADGWFGGEPLAFLRHGGDIGGVFFSHPLGQVTFCDIACDTSGHGHRIFLSFCRWQWRKMDMWWRRKDLTWDGDAVYDMNTKCLQFCHNWYRLCVLMIFNYAG